jgi:hypothetical protein
MTAKSPLDEMLESEVEQADPQELARRQLWLDWEAKMLGIRMQMLRGQIDEQTASSMAEHANQEYLTTEQRYSTDIRGFQ